MKLYERDYADLARKCADCANAGISAVSVGKKDETLTLTVDVTVEGYTEDDYYNGTGAFIPVTAECRVIDVELSSLDEKAKTPNVDTARIEFETEKILLTL